MGDGGVDEQWQSGRVVEWQSGRDAVNHFATLPLCYFATFLASHGDFERAKRTPGVAVGFFRPDGEGFVGDGDGQIAEAVVFVGEDAAEDGGDVGFSKGFKAEECGARDEGGIDCEKGIFGGCADEGDEAALDIAQQNVLLALGEAMDFIEEENRAFVLKVEAFGGFVADFANALDAYESCVLADEVALGVFGDEFGEGGFASAGRAVEDHAGDRVGGEHAAEKFAWAQDVELASEFVERARTHADGERLDTAAGILAFGGPEVHA